MRHPFLMRGLALALVLAGALAVASTAGAARYIVLYKGANVPRDADRQIARAGGSLVIAYDRIGVALADSDDPAFLERLDGRGRVTDAAPVPGFDEDGPEERPDPREPKKLGRLPNQPASDADTFSPFQWSLRQIGVAAAHAVTGGSPAVLVGDLDSGVDYEHPDLAPNLDLGNSASCAGGVPNQAADPTTGRLPFDDTVGHGTQTAGIIAADDNGIGIVGVAPNVRLAAVKVTAVDPRDGGTKIFPEAAICGFMWAAEHGFDVVNASLGVDRPEANVPAARVGYYCRSNPADRTVVTAVGRAVRYALRQGVTVVASAGNTGVDLTNPPAGADCVRMPVGLPGVIGVSGESAQRQKTFNSNYGLGAIELTAPGGDPLQPAFPPAVPTPTGQVLTTWPRSMAARAAKTDPTAVGAYYQNQFGTSAAAPLVSGVAALVVSRFGDEKRHGDDVRMKPNRVRAMLERSADPLACPPNPYVRVVNAPPPFGGTWTATCDGMDELNGFFGHGQVNALAAITPAERPGRD